MSDEIKSETVQAKTEVKTENKPTTSIKSTEKGTPQKTTGTTSVNNKIIINLNGPIEIINMTNSQRHSIMPKPAKKVKLINTNLYRIPITDAKLTIDNANTIKQYAKYAEHFQIVSVSKGVVTILPIISGFELSHDDQIGELI